MNKYLDKVYQEHHSDTFTLDKKQYPINKYLRQGASKSTVMMPVSELEWVLKYDTPDPVRLEKADLSAPLLVTRWQDKWVAVDGLHRLTKAVKTGVRELPCKIISLN